MLLTLLVSNGVLAEALQRHISPGRLGAPPACTVLVLDMLHLHVECSVVTQSLYISNLDSTFGTSDAVQAVLVLQR